jgi:peptide/nickel transport system permease protein
MLAFILRRLLFLPVVMFGVTLIIVLLMQLLTPAQRASSYVRSPAQLQNLEVIIEQYGLNDPWYVQYGSWVSQAFQGNFGYSITAKKPVLDAIRERFPRTAQLALLAIFPVVGVGIWLGTAAALHRDRLVDQVTRIISIFGWSIPTFVLGIWLLIIFYGWFDILKPGPYSARYEIEVATRSITLYTNAYLLDALLNLRLDFFWDALKHLILPVITLAVVSSAQIMRVMRSSLLDALNQDYVRTARAKGLPENVVNLKHARRNALIPIVTLSGFTLISLMSGVVITETIFNYPGLGSWGANAATQLDYASILGFAVFTAFIVVVANLVVDILYAVVDPRIRYT